MDLSQLYVTEHNMEIALNKAIKSYYEKSRNYTVNANIKTTSEQVEAAAKKIKDVKGKIKKTREEIDEAYKQGRYCRLDSKNHLIKLYNELGNLQQAYNSKYSIAAQLAQTAKAATEIAKAL